MDFRLTEQQVELQDLVRAFCVKHYAVTDIGALDREPLRAGDWGRLVDLDIFRLAAPASSGGSAAISTASISLPGSSSVSILPLAV